MRIEEEIKQSRFKGANEKAIINILYTSNWLNRQLHRFYGLYDISSQQFNVLRILRGLNDKPASISLLNERMLDKMSNVSRLVDKLIVKGFVSRQVCEADRRQVDVVITAKGLTVVNEISTKLDNEIQNLVHLNDDDAETLSNLLDRLRG